MTKITFVGGTRDGLTQEHALADGVHIVGLPELTESKPVEVSRSTTSATDICVTLETYHIQRLDTCYGAGQRAVSTFVIAHPENLSLGDVYQRLLQSYCNSSAKEG